MPYSNIDKNKSKLNPHVSVDCVIFGFDFDELKVLLIERENLSAEGGLSIRNFSLPGNLISDDENLDQSAKRVLYELTGLTNIREEPSARVITVAYYSLVKLDAYSPTAASFAKKAEWYPITTIPALAFDHNHIVNKAFETLKSKLQSQPLGFELLPEKFTLGQLQKLYEIILGTELDKRNFRRKILNKKILIPLIEKQKGVPHKQAQLFMFDKEKYEEVKNTYFGFDF